MEDARRAHVVHEHAFATHLRRQIDTRHATPDPAIFGGRFFRHWRRHPERERHPDREIEVTHSAVRARAADDSILDVQQLGGDAERMRSALEQHVPRLGHRLPQRRPTDLDRH